MEKIICSAIWYKELPTQNHLPFNIDFGTVVCGKGHAHCIQVVKALTGLRTVLSGENSVGDYIQGFLTTSNRFVERHEAFDIAEAAGQLNDRVRGESRYLYSEDIY